PAILELAKQFADSGYQITPTFASTGKLYTQILHGAPFDIFLAADQKHPQMLVQQAIAEDQFTYARGQLMLVGSSTSQPLLNNSFTRLAIANPRLAPYGAAAQELFRDMLITHQVRSKLVIGDNVGQAMAIFATGNADIALVARSLGEQLSADVPRWLVPPDRHSPINQDAVRLLKQPKKRPMKQSTKQPGNPAAAAFMAFLKSAEAQATIRSFGYL
ncbi:MAG: molybdate ABC transporter substrate-binding protein, partial [Pseudomonadota bacterium]